MTGSPDAALGTAGAGGGPSGAEGGNPSPGPISVSCLSEAQRDALEETGFVFHDGVTPPAVSGRYLADSLAVLFDDEAGIEDGDASGLAFEGTSDVFSYTYGFLLDVTGPTLTLRYQATGDYYHQDDGSGPASLTGEGGCFTICSKTESYSADCDYSARHVISACLVNSGLRDFRHALLMASKGASCYRLLRVGSRRLMGESDGLVEAE